MSQSQIIDGRALSERICQALIPAIVDLSKQLGHPLGLTVILVGHRQESITYVKTKQRTARSLGINSQCLQFEISVSTEEILVEIDALNRDPTVQAILIQLPLPGHINTDMLLARIDPNKDVDGFHPINVGRLTLGNTEPCLVPCTPLGVMAILDDLEIDLIGKRIVLIGASRVVGLPLFHCLLNRQATVTVCHEMTIDLPAICRQAEILIVACGQPEMIKADWISPETVVIDVGINYVSKLPPESPESSPESHETSPSGFSELTAKQWASPSGFAERTAKQWTPETYKSNNQDNKLRLVGDVDFNSVLPKVKSITPVPGGIGPLTVAMLMANTVKTAQLQLNNTSPNKIPPIRLL